MINPMKVMVFGSCMSNLAAFELIHTYGFEQTHSVHHNRSDAFLTYYVDKTNDMIPLEYWESKLIYKEDPRGEAKQFLINQYPEGLGFHGMMDKKRPGKSFIEDVEEIQADVILMDNFMDIAAKLVYSNSDPFRATRPLFLNHGFYQNEMELAQEYVHTEYLTPTESAENWLRIYRWLRERQPKAHIFFLPYHSCSSYAAPDRYRRARDFYLEFEPLARDEDLFLIPPVETVPELTKGEEDWPHFQIPIYKGLAGYIYLHTVGGLARPGQLHRLPPALH